MSTEISLTALTKEYLGFIHAWEKDPQVYTFYNSGEPIEPSSNLKDYRDYYIILSEQIPIGVVMLRPWLNAIHTMSYIGDPTYRGRGLTKNINIARINYVRQHFNVSQIESSVSIINVPAWKALVRSGFKINGIKVDASKTTHKSQTLYSDELQFTYRLDSLEDGLLDEVHESILGYLTKKELELIAQFNKVTLN